MVRWVKRTAHQFPRLHEDKFYGHLLLMGALRFIHPTQLVVADFSLRPCLYTMLSP